MALYNVSFIFIICLVIIHQAELQRTAVGTTQVARKLDYCSVVGDPHLYIFDSNSDQWCIQTGWQVLLQNKKFRMEIDVAGPPAGFYPVQNFKIQVFGGCTITPGCLAAFSCGCGAGIWFASSLSPPTWYINFPGVAYIKITQWGSYYNIEIQQHPSQFGYSSGLCVCGCPPSFIYNWGGRKKRQSASNCEETLKKWIENSKHKFKPTDEGQKSFLTVCENDFRASGDGKFTDADTDILLSDVIQQYDAATPEDAYKLATSMAATSDGARDAGK